MDCDLDHRMYFCCIKSLISSLLLLYDMFFIAAVWICVVHVQRSYISVSAVVPGECPRDSHVSASKPGHAGGGGPEWDHPCLGPHH